jgi:cyclopropane fatty-acyl-phospholipid synthase-like methyltransferase
MDMDDIYKKMHSDKIPWNMEKPPEVLVELIDSGKVRPCRTVDFGCGTGNYAVYLAGRGFDVTGIDISPAAIRMAEEKATKNGVRCRFIAADVLGDLRELEETFDFAYDWELLHHLFPEQRKKYVKNVHAKIHAEGRYLSVCFSEEDPHFGGSGKYRETPIGTVLYFSSEDEIRNLFEPFFHIDELSTVWIRGKAAPHPAIRAFMKKR